LADDVNQAIYCAGLLVDEGYARWKDGDNRSALDCLVKGLSAIDGLPSDDADENAYLLRKRAGYTIMYNCKHYRWRGHLCATPGFLQQFGADKGSKGSVYAQ